PVVLTKGTSMLRPFLFPRSLFVAALSAAFLLPAGCKRQTPTPSAPIEVVSPEPAKRPGPEAGAVSELGEVVLPADKAPDSAPLRPAKGIPIYKLTDPRIGNPGPGPSPTLTVHYERVSSEARGTGPALVMRTPDGN